MNAGDPAQADRHGYFELLGVSPNFTEWPLGLSRLFLSLWGIAWVSLLVILGRRLLLGRQAVGLQDGVGGVLGTGLGPGW